jgi:hypothetical protein
MRESRIEAYFVEQANAQGCLVRKAAWVGRKGCPDRVVMFPDGRIVWVELKASGLAAGFPSNAHERQQDREHERMRRRGQQVEIVDSFERVDEVLA